MEVKHPMAYLKKVRKLGVKIKIIIFTKRTTIEKKISKKHLDVRVRYLKSCGNNEHICYCGNSNFLLVFPLILVPSSVIA